VWFLNGENKMAAKTIRNFLTNLDSFIHKMAKNHDKKVHITGALENQTQIVSALYPFEFRTNFWHLKKQQF
jgi:hypothetical protein